MMPCSTSTTAFTISPNCSRARLRNSSSVMGSRTIWIGTGMGLLSGRRLDGGSPSDAISPGRRRQPRADDRPMPRHEPPHVPARAGWRGSMAKPAASTVRSVSRFGRQPPATRVHAGWIRSCTRARQGRSDRTCSSIRSVPPGRRTRRDLAEARLRVVDAAEDEAAHDGVEGRRRGTAAPRPAPGQAARRARAAGRGGADRARDRAPPCRREQRQVPAGAAAEVEDAPSRPVAEPWRQRLSPVHSASARVAS